jgi:hypothetical protein
MLIDSVYHLLLKKKAIKMAYMKTGMKTATGGIA